MSATDLTATIVLTVAVLAFFAGFAWWLKVMSD